MSLVFFLFNIHTASQKEAIINTTEQTKQKHITTAMFACFTVQQHVNLRGLGDGARATHSWVHGGVFNDSRPSGGANVENVCGAEGCGMATLTYIRISATFSEACKSQNEPCPKHTARLLEAPFVG